MREWRQRASGTAYLHGGDDEGDGGNGDEVVVDDEKRVAEMDKAGQRVRSVPISRE